MLQLGSASYYRSIMITAALGISAATGCVGSGDDLEDMEAAGSEESYAQGLDGEVGASDAAQAAVEGQAAVDDQESSVLEGGGGVPLFVSDAEITGVIRDFAQLQISHCNGATGRAIAGEVLGFANQMVNYYTGFLGRQGAICDQYSIVPIGGAQCDSFMGEINGLFGPVGLAGAAEFDRHYIGAQIGLHTRMLDLFDNHILSHCTNEALRGELTGLRWMTLRHLIQAQFIGCTLEGAGVDACAAQSYSAYGNLGAEYVGEYCP
ncbi:hypothetical protein [Chondromyces crocatus]|uniref:Uncharacterized protein n=1 Tax=Chondromyces crocatus TaxID=52 RepID=A0A0K1EM75_CHOCO|nr:hypothetical protein [Chondromyces crocatus]AKT41916.1 uncharacterized protein CMC5_061380 [Chondromyces crocatus]